MKAERFESVADEKWYRGETAWHMGLPYLTPSAVESLSQKIQHPTVAVEFGAGGSTLWLASRFSLVHSYETSPEWIKKVQDRLRSRGLNNVILEPMGNLRVLSNESVDFVLVDSEGSRTNRVALSQMSMAWIRRGGIFVLDNYSRYKLNFLDEETWDIELHDEPHWDGSGTLIATRLP